MRRYKGTFDIFGKDEMEEQFKKEAQEGWRFAADAARITDNNASSEDRKHTSGRVFVAVDRNLGAVIGTEEAAVESILGGMRAFSVYFWHSQDWTPRNEALLEAVVKQAKATRHPSNSLRGKITQMEAVEDFESRPHKAVSFVVERDKEVQEWSEQMMPTALPGYSGGRLP